MPIKPISKPKKRSFLRDKAAVCYHSAARYAAWFIHGGCFAGEISPAPLPYILFHHETVLLRRLKDLDMQLQFNKVTNLRLAASKLDGVIVRPGEVFSFWKLIGRPTYKKGYLDGLVLKYGVVGAGCGGGLCQLSNLIYWMTLHTPLTVVERHRHGYDIFPDSARTQPFGSGATCFYPYGDLMIKNETTHNFQLKVHVGTENLIGEWRSDQPIEYSYEIVERNHRISGEYWGGYSRHNELYRRVYDTDGQFVREEFVTENHALMLYSPLIEAPDGA